MHIKDLVFIRSGSPEYSEVTGEAIRFVRMKNVDHERYRINWDEVETLRHGHRPVKCLKQDEILLIAKGERNTAVLVPNLTFCSIAANQFFILSIKEEFQFQVDPLYLTWYLNFPAREYFISNSTGAVIPNLRKETVGNLKIALPPISDQKWIVSVYQSMVEQKILFSQLFEDRINLLCNEIQKKEWM